MAELLGNRYRLEGQLGSGGMGVVHRAYDRLTGEQVALKQVLIEPRRLTFNSQTDRSSTSLLALANEFRILAAMCHPYIISVLDYGFDSGRHPYFTMQLIENGARITHYASKITLSAKIDLLLQLLYALDYLHRRGVIHRDLKPGNILVGSDQQVRVLDFGLALSSNQSGETAGTISYIAPEILRGEPATFASDLYVFGIIAYEILAGRHPLILPSSTRSVRQSPADRTLDFSKLPAPFDTILQPLFADEPFERYTSAQEVIDLLSRSIGLPAPLETEAVRESFLQAAQFVGRERELDQLVTAFRETRSKMGSAWLIGGESGIGKTRLLAELLVQSQVEGALVLYGQAAQGGGVFFGLWREAIRRLALVVELSDLEAGVLATVAPDMDRLLERPITPPPAVSERVQLDRLIQTIVGVFRRAATPEVPILLILEDLQWTLEGLEPLRQLLTLIAGLPILVVASYRDDERPDLPDLLPGMQLIALKRLDSHNIETLSAAMLGETVLTRSMLELLERETEGNAYFLVEVVRALAEAAGGLYQVRDESLPQKIVAGGIQQIIRRRLEHVPSWGQPMLRAAAILGRQLDQKVLAFLQEHEHLLPPDQTLESWLDACDNAAVIRLQSAAYGFDHDKLREALREDLLPAEFRNLHRMAAESLEAVYPNDENIFGILSDHWHGAEVPEKERLYAKKHGDKLKSLGYFREAVANYQRALSLVSLDSTDLATQAERADLLREIASAQVILTEYESAAQTADECLTLARAINHRIIEAAALRSLGMLENIRGDYKRFQELYEESLAISRAIEDKQGIAISLKEIAFAYELQGQFDAAMQCHEEALAIQHELNNLMGIASVINDMGIIHAQRGEFPQAGEKWRESLRIKQEIGDRRGEAATLMNLGLFYQDSGELEAAREYTTNSARLWREIGDKRYEAAALNNLSSILQDLDLYDEARYFQDESLALKRAISDPQGVVDSLDNLAILEMYQGNFAAAIKIGEESLPIRRQLGDPVGTVKTQHHTVEAKLNLGQTEGVDKSLREMIEIALQIAAPPVYLMALIALAHKTWREGDPVRSMELLGLSEKLDPSLSKSLRFFINRYRPQVEAALDEATCNAAVERGRALDPEPVLRAALQSL